MVLIYYASITHRGPPRSARQGLGLDRRRHPSAPGLHRHLVAPGCSSFGLFWDREQVWEWQYQWADSEVQQLKLQQVWRYTTGPLRLPWLAIFRVRALLPAALCGLGVKVKPR